MTIIHRSKGHDIDVQSTRRPVYSDSDFKRVDKHRAWVFVREILALLFIILIAAFVGAYLSNAFAGDASLMWDPVTTMDDGKPITGPVTYNIYLDGAQINSNIKLLNFFVGGYFSDTGCFTVRAVINGVESADSPKLCKPAPRPTSTKPAAPKNLR